MDPDTDEISSNLDEEADKQTFATVFQAWAEGRISGTADEVFEAIKWGCPASGAREVPPTHWRGFVPWPRGVNTRL